MSAGTGGATPLVSPAFLLLHSNTGSTHATLALRALHPVALGESAAWLAERCSELRALAVHHSSGAWQVPYWIPLVLTLGIVGPNDLQAWDLDLVLWMFNPESLGRARVNKFKRPIGRVGNLQRRDRTIPASIATKREVSWSTTGSK